MSTPDNKQSIAVAKIAFWVLIYAIETIKRKSEKSPISEAEYAFYNLENQIKKDIYL